MNIKRVFASILVGIFFPILYASAGGLLVDRVLPEGSETAQIGGQQVPGPLFAPIAIPVYIDALLGSYEYFGSGSIFDNPWFRSTFYMLFNFLLFTIAAYLGLKRLGWFSSGPAGNASGTVHTSESGSV